MAIFRRAVLATALVGTGLAATTGAAFAGENDHDGDSHSKHEDGGTTQKGLVNVSDVQTIVPINACNNDIPVNVLGVQVPVQDVAGNLPILSPSDDGGGNSAGIAKDCSGEVAAKN